MGKSTVEFAIELERLMVTGDLANKVRETLNLLIETKQEEMKEETDLVLIATKNSEIVGMFESLITLEQLFMKEQLKLRSKTCKN